MTKFIIFISFILTFLSYQAFTKIPIIENFTFSDSIVKFQLEYPASLLTELEEKQLQDWFYWKNNATRYSANLDQVSRKFAPEESYYKTSVVILMIVYMFIGSLFLAFAVLFAFFRYGLAFLRGKSLSSVIAVSRASRWIYFITLGVSICLWFAGMVIAWKGGSAFMKDTNNSNEILNSKSVNVIDKIMHFYSIAKEFSSGNYSDPTSTGTNETIKIDMQYKEPILYEAKLNQDGAKSLSSYLKNDEESINAWAICVFAMTFVFIILTILSIIKRYSTLIKVIGVLLFIISALSFIGTGLWIREVYKLGDYCEQDQKLMNGIYNDAGKGMFYFLNCFNDTNLIGINIAIFQTIFALKNSTQYYMNYLKEIDMNEYNQTLSQSDIIKNYKLHPDNSSLIHWGDAISMLDGALQDVLQLKQCIPTRQYASFAEKNFCKNGLDDAYLGYVGLLVESIALVLLSWAALNLRPVIEKFKEESETMISVRETA